MTTPRTSGREGQTRARRTDPRSRDARLLPEKAKAKRPRGAAVVDCGWGRLLFGQTFDNPHDLVEELKREETGRRDIAIYVDEPHVALSLAPDRIFLDPSHVYRLWLQHYRPGAAGAPGVTVRQAASRADGQAVNLIYERCRMAATSPDFTAKAKASRAITVFVAERAKDGRILGVAMGVDHARAFDDPENGASLWSLAVDPSTSAPKVGETLVRRLAEHFQARGRAFMDLSVMHDNAAAIALYERLGFKRAQIFSLKYKNPLNETLYSAEAPEDDLNPYARIIVDEARRRGVMVEVEDAAASLVRLTYGGRSVNCRESLSDLTTAVAAARCQDKALCIRLLRAAGLKTPEHVTAGGGDDRAFLEQCGRVVVKPADGEGGAGVSIDVRTEDELENAVVAARRISDAVLIERMHPGDDLRVIVIDGDVVACAIRKPASVVGDGENDLKTLIERQSRRRQAATGGESRIPLDDETRRCVEAQGYALDDILRAGVEIPVRRTANLHTGGTLHDVTDETHPALKGAAIEAAATLALPVAGVDMLTPDVRAQDYVIIEVNERPGLANHEPRPTAEKFLDMLFPHTTRRR